MRLQGCFAGMLESVWVEQVSLGALTLQKISAGLACHLRLRQDYYLINFASSALFRNYYKRLSQRILLFCGALC